MSRSIRQHAGPETDLPVQRIFESLCNSVREHMSKAGTLGETLVKMEQGLSSREEDGSSARHGLGSSDKATDSFKALVVLLWKGRWRQYRAPRQGYVVN